MPLLVLCQLPAHTLRLGLIQALAALEIARIARSESDLLALAQDLSKSPIIGVDGVMSSGKSWTAKRLGDWLDRPVVECDDFVRHGKLFYPHTLDLVALQAEIAALQAAGTAMILDSVMLRLVLKAIGDPPTRHIYVRRHNLDGTLHSPELFLGLSTAEMIANENELCRVIGIADDEPILARELIHYHDAFRPFDSADVVFENTVDGS